MPRNRRSGCDIFLTALDISLGLAVFSILLELVVSLLA